jgi:hypothetical protein
MVRLELHLLVRVTVMNPTASAARIAIDHEYQSDYQQDDLISRAKRACIGCCCCCCNLTTAVVTTVWLNRFANPASLQTWAWKMSWKYLSHS